MSFSMVRAAMTVGVLSGVLAGCQQAPRARASAAAASACRAEVDRVYAAQNRVDLSLRDQRDTPFAGSYNSGITSRGLSGQYGRDNQFNSCLNNANDPAPAVAAPGTGPTFSPTAR